MFNLFSFKRIKKGTNKEHCGFGQILKMIKTLIFKGRYYSRLK